MRMRIRMKMVFRMIGMRMMMMKKIKLMRVMMKRIQM